MATTEIVQSNQRGRPKGSGNKMPTSLRESIVAKYKLLPLDHLMEILNDKSLSTERRDWAAEKAAPYIHARVNTHEISGPDGGPIETKNDVVVTLVSSTK